MDTLQDFSIDCLVLTKHLNVSPNNSLNIPVISSDSSGSTVVRRMIISYESPPLLLGDEVVLWFNPETWTFYKSTNWKESTFKWEEQTEYGSLFEETSSGGGMNSGGMMTTPLFLSRNPVEDNEAVTKVYLETRLASMTTGSGNMAYGDPVPDINSLRQLDVTLIPDKQIRYVESLNRIFAYDLHSVLPADNEYTVSPLSGVGRWCSTDKMLVDSGIF